MRNNTFFDKMKKACFLLLVLSLFATVDAMAQDDYAVFKFSKDVMIKKQKQKTWTVAKRRMPLSVGDSIRIGRNSSVGIINKKTNITSRANKNGTFSVRNIVEQSQNLVEAYVGTLKDGVEDRKKTKILYNQIGASTMSSGTVDGVNIEEQVYSILYDKVIKTNARKGLKSSSTIKYKKEYIASDEFIFVIENRTPTPYYFNIMKFGSKANLCFLPMNENKSYDMFLPAHSTVELNHNVFADTDDDKTKYILFATKTPFNQQILQNLLEENKKIKVKSCDIDVVFGFVKE